MYKRQQLGFRKGVNIVSDMGGNLLQKLTEGASILGLDVYKRQLQYRIHHLRLNLALLRIHTNKRQIILYTPVQTTR